MKIIEIARSEIDSTFPILTCFSHLSICPVGAIKAESILMIELYMRTSGFSKITSPTEYLNLPNILVETYDVIEHEIKRIQKVRDESDG